MKSRDRFQVAGQDSSGGFGGGEFLEEALHGRGGEEVQLLPGTLGDDLEGVCGAARHVDERPRWALLLPILHEHEVRAFKDEEKASAASWWMCIGGPKPVGSFCVCNNVKAFDVSAAPARTTVSKLPRSRSSPRPGCTINGLLMAQCQTASLLCKAVNGHPRWSIRGGVTPPPVGNAPGATERRVETPRRRLLVVRLKKGPRGAIRPHTSRTGPGRRQGSATVLRPALQHGIESGPAGHGTTAADGAIRGDRSRRRRRRC